MYDIMCMGKKPTNVKNEQYLFQFQVTHHMLYLTKKGQRSSLSLKRRQDLYQNFSTLLKEFLAMR